MMRRQGRPTALSCPACGGALWELHDGTAVRYSCHVGHQYAPDSLLADHAEAVEEALWAAVRILEQHAELRSRMAGRAEGAGMRSVAARFTDASHDYHRQARQVRRLLFGDEDPERRPRVARREREGAVD